MNEKKQNRMDTYFTDRVSHYKALAQQLSSDERGDEAIFAKVQMNVYDIFHTIYSTAAKTSGQDDKKVVEFFLTKIQQIPQRWQSALTDAKKHSDSSKAHIEQLKLDTAAQIKAAFEKIWEETA